MALKRCENGHYFDPGKHTSCPSCGVQNINFEPTRQKDPSEDIGINAGLGVNAGAGAGVAQTSPRQGFDAARAARSASSPSPSPADEGKTVSLIRKKAGIDPVVGWLVCVSGADRGRDFRIRSEKNFIGRSETMDVCIPGDDTISRENHAIISFNPKSRQFKLHPGESRGLVYLNGDEVDQPSGIKGGDHIELGQTKLMFVPLCTESFTWE